MKKSKVALLLIGLFAAAVFAVEPKDGAVAAGVLTVIEQSEYPRPTMSRSDWCDLNGSWDYGFTTRQQTNSGSFAGKIQIPFPVESKASGVNKLFTELQRLWYHRTFNVPAGWQGAESAAAF